MQVGERKGRFHFFEEKCRKSVWPGYGEPQMELGERILLIGVRGFLYLPEVQYGRHIHARLWPRTG